MADLPFESWGEIDFSSITDQQYSSVIESILNTFEDYLDDRRFKECPPAEDTPKTVDDYAYIIFKNNRSEIWGLYHKRDQYLFAAKPVRCAGRLSTKPFERVKDFPYPQSYQDMREVSDLNVTYASLLASSTNRSYSLRDMSNAVSALSRGFANNDQWGPSLRTLIGVTSDAIKSIGMKRHVCFGLNMKLNVPFLPSNRLLRVNQCWSKISKSIRSKRFDYVMTYRDDQGQEVEEAVTEFSAGLIFAIINSKDGSKEEKLRNKQKKDQYKRKRDPEKEYGGKREAGRGKGLQQQKGSQASQKRGGKYKRSASGSAPGDTAAEEHPSSLCNSMTSEEEKEWSIQADKIPEPNEEYPRASISVGKPPFDYSDEEDRPFKVRIYDLSSDSESDSDSCKDAKASLYPLRSRSDRYLSSFNLTHCRTSATLMASETPASPTNGSVVTSPNPQRTYQVVVAATQNMGIGKDGSLPWKLPSDLKFFKDVTMTTSDPLKRNVVIMGRKTWESIPLQHRPLPGRFNVVLTRSGSFDIATDENVVKCGSMLSALELLAEPPYCVSIEKVFIIGGGQIYREALNAPGCDAVHITEIEEHIECDTFIPPLDKSVFKPWYSSFPVVENNIRYCFTTYVRVRNSGVELTSEGNDQLSDGNLESGKFESQRFSSLPKPVYEKHEEYLYLRLVENIISNGMEKNDRTRTGTVAIFGCQMRFNLRKSFPLLTTKKVFWRGVVEELLWFISGSTNAKVLKEKGIDIWEGNGSREYLDSIGLAHREDGDLGPVYGFQWRHFGARYTDMHADYTGQGFDQLLDVISKIKNDPDDRSIILSAWNPSDLKLMALPPCHMFAQFYVANGELSCQMYQCSADMGLGVPFNIASYALLTCMIAHVCDLVPGEFVHTIGDAHISYNHIRSLQDQLQKQPKPFPVLKINSEKRDIDSFEAADFKLIGYDPHQKIAMKMAV